MRALEKITKASPRGHGKKGPVLVGTLWFPPCPSQPSNHVSCSYDVVSTPQHQLHEMCLKDQVEKQGWDGVDLLVKPGFKEFRDSLPCQQHIPKFQNQAFWQPDCGCRRHHPATALFLSRGFPEPDFLPEMTSIVPLGVWAPNTGAWGSTKLGPLGCVLFRGYLAFVGFIWPWSKSRTPNKHPRPH